MAGSIVIRRAADAADIETVRALFREYALWLAIDLSFQGFDAELAGLPGAYAPPKGRLLLAGDGVTTAGCVGLRALSHDTTGSTAELKRLWVRPGFRGNHVGRTLSETALTEARSIGYRLVKLDTLPDKMPEAQKMYRGLGFRECAPYYVNPIAGSLYMECVL